MQQQAASATAAAAAQAAAVSGSIRGGVDGIAPAIGTCQRVLYFSATHPSYCYL